MKTAAHRSGVRAPPSGARRALGDLAAALALVLGTAAATWRLLGLPASYMWVVAALYAALAGALLRTAPAELKGPGLGAANRVTLARAALVVPVCALAVLLVSLSTAGRWWVISLSTVVMILDGLDGLVARRTGTQTAFGARFDMELDAALIMALALLVWTSDRAGVWVLLIGLMRYFFVAASWIWPVLRSELPESSRRRVVCVVQGVALLVALGPIISAREATGAAAVGLAALTYSFAVDVRWALRDAREGRAPRTERGPE